MDKVQFNDCKISKFGQIKEKDDANECTSIAIALDTNGKVYSWGNNEYGQLGHGDCRDRKLPTQILALKKKEINKMTVSTNFVVMLGKDVKII